MCSCMLLVNPRHIAYLMNVFVDVYCIYYTCIQILAHYGSMYVSMYRMSVSLCVAYTLKSIELTMKGTCGLEGINISVTMIN